MKEIKSTQRVKLRQPDDPAQVREFNGRPLPLRLGSGCPGLSAIYGKVDTTLLHRILSTPIREWGRTGFSLLGSRKRMCRRSAPKVSGFSAAEPRKTVPIILGRQARRNVKDLMEGTGLQAVGHLRRATRLLRAHAPSSDGSSASCPSSRNDSSWRVDMLVTIWWGSVYRTSTGWDVASSPGFYLGKMFWKKDPLIDFCLQF
jgi:hypothetical protein